MRFLAIFMLAVGLLMTGGAEANLVGVDFGLNTNQDPNLTPQNWTASDGSSSLTNLQDDSGTPTSVGLSLIGTPLAYDAAPLSTTVPQYSYSLTNIARNIYSLTSGDILMVTISGLTPGESYPVYVFGLRTYTGFSYSQTISLIGANTVTFTQAGNSGQLTVNDQVGSSSSNLSSYAKSVTADSNGRIQVQVTGDNDGYFLAGLAIGLPSAIPTLSEWTQLLLALVVMSVVGWHFHRERSY